ncbi:hypothetical protein NRY68_05895 [Acidithiobacillus ferrooxidans]|jgi:hypothetical protein|uniref:hypothetical protein n=1 Tax=Acidithiobacillus TaxID=119977 RepID=UPI0021477037|nr:hypothetical protein [Acidithiobacillus ferrooxidans]MCR1345339.1 hypothetical protein [Acidithiobacillus ferrooxidans]MCR1354499.1 hypothetical protein [Acidithiobacillus ferrooxidans]
MDTVLLHATSVENMELIKSSGMLARSYWTNDTDLAAYYAETVEDDGFESVIIAVRLKDLDEAFIQPDYPGLEEPITGVLGSTEERIWKKWEASERGWINSLSIVHSVRYIEPIQASLLLFDYQEN